MGGEDIGSDDEFYLDQNWAKTEKPKADNIIVEDVLNNKRSIENNDNDNQEEISSKNNKKRKKLDYDKLSPSNLLVHAGRGISHESAEKQSKFLWTCFQHWLGMKSTTSAKDGTQVNEQDAFKPPNFYTTNQNDGNDDNQLQPHQVITLANFLRKGALSSNKRLKKWKIVGSPMVLIITLSARRAVSMLKEDLSSLKLRVAKLFAKHMEIEDQIRMLTMDSYGLAIGTPNRLWRLSTTSKNDDGKVTGAATDGATPSSPALSLEHTELIVIDCHEDHKKYTVCTMNDTATDLMRFIRDAVIPQIRARKERIRFAFF
mmetsp:Transcript_14612/g.20843  ORF Transcript_14612/g.20843 Transcript_14612/m.20843 type:complete len:316 (+) Transcript_14612:60-1007(+)